MFEKRTKSNRKKKKSCLGSGRLHFRPSPRSRTARCWNVSNKSNLKPTTSASRHDHEDLISFFLSKSQGVPQNTHRIRHNLPGCSLNSFQYPQPESQSFRLIWNNAEETQIHNVGPLLDSCIKVKYIKQHYESNSVASCFPTRGQYLTLDVWEFWVIRNESHAISKNLMKTLTVSVLYECVTKHILFDHFNFVQYLFDHVLTISHSPTFCCITLL